MYDVYDTSAPGAYECLHCGELVEADRPPVDCAGCGQSGTFQHRAMSLE